MKKEEWISNLKIGDFVYYIENHPGIPGGKWKWKAEVVKIESNYIETVHQRERGLAWLEAVTLKLASNHRTFSKTWNKNYFGPEGGINIEKLKM